MGRTRRCSRPRQPALLCQGFKFQRLPRLLSWGVRHWKMRMSWSSITEVELELLVAEGMAAMEPPVSRLWSLLQIRPAKWQLPPWGDEGGGFWVVGIIGNWV